MTPKQKRFCEEYLVDLNATQAYYRAGYSPKSEAVAYSCSSRLLGNAKVEAYIQELMQKQQERTKTTADQVIQELSYIALSRIDDVMALQESNIALINPEDLDERARAAIASVTRSRSKTGVTLHNKVKALELLGKHLGLFSDINMAIATVERFGGRVIFDDEQ